MSDSSTPASSAASGTSAPLSSPPSSVTPAVPSGSDGTAPTTPSSAGAATTQPLDAEDDLNAPDWLDVSKRGKILDNARSKAAAKERDRLIAEDYLGMTPSQFAQWAPTLRALATNPREVAQWMATQFGLLQQAEPRTPPPAMPEPDLVAEDGTPAFSAKAMDGIIAFVENRIDQKYADRFRHYDETAGSLQQQNLNVAAHQHAAMKLKEAESWEGFQELREKIHALMQRDGRYSLEGAYNKVFQDEYLPTLKARVRSETLKGIQNQPVIQDVNPKAVPRTSLNGRTFKNLDDRIEAAFASVGKS